MKLCVAWFDLNCCVPRRCFVFYTSSPPSTRVVVNRIFFICTAHAVYTCDVVVCVLCAHFTLLTDSVFTDDFYIICSSPNESVLSSYGICISIVGNVWYTRIVRGCTNIDSSVDETGFLLFFIDKCLAIYCGPKTLSVVSFANCTDWRWEAHHFTHEWLLIIFISVNSFNKPMTVTHLCIARSSSFAMISLVSCHFS